MTLNPHMETPIDPSEYDLGELQATAEDGFIYPEADPTGREPKEALRTGQFKELLLLQTTEAGSGLQRPYLESLPESHEGERMLFEWLEFLVEKGGFKRACEAIRYYRDLEWVTESVAQELRNHLVGIPEAAPDDYRPFGRSDHLLSLIYIGRLGST